MKFFKNVEAASLYHVSEKSVRNWIESAQKGKLDLELYEHNGRRYLANTTKNHTAIKKLVEKGQKFKNSRGYKIVEPKAKFYELYGPEQVFDILSNLDIYREIPLQYSYVDEGAEHWDLYAKRLFDEDEANTLTSTIRLIENSIPHLQTLLQGVNTVNVIDLGVGNALPVKEFLRYLLNKGILKRYIGIDISGEMLKIAAQNINEWFEDNIHFEAHLKDINYDRFEHILAEDAFGDGKNKSVNLVLLLGGTLSNMRIPARVLQMINDSMGRDDMLLYTLKLDSENSRRYFNFDVRRQTRKLNQQLGSVITLLNIPESVYSVEHVYDSEKRARFIHIILNVDISIRFDMGGKTRRVNLYKGDKITVWRARHQSTLEVLDELEANNFSLLHASKTPDQEYLLTISKVKSEAPR